MDLGMNFEGANRESFTLPHLFQSESSYSSQSDWNFWNSVHIFYYVFYTI
jgi:hypothetical protein